MLRESSQDIKMSEKEKLKLQIHHSNLFRPNPIGAKLLSWGIDSNLMVVVKVPKAEADKIHANIIEIYDTVSNLAPRLVGSIICHENITGVAWIGFECILTTSREQTISIYSVKEMRKIYSIITDYGPILSLAYYKFQSLIITSTEYGYVAAYRVGHNSKFVEPISKMVKINSKIVCVAASIKQNESQPTPMIVEQETPNRRARKRKRSRNDTGDDNGVDGDPNSLDKLEITIFGASEGNVIAWNFHKTTIIETVPVCDEPHTVNCLLALTRGDVIAADSSGVMTTIDVNSFTCMRTAKISDYSLTTMGISPKEDKILLSGMDPTIHIMKRCEIDKREYRFLEKTRVHTQQVTSIMFVSKTDIYSCAINGIIVKIRTDGESKRLEKYQFISSHFSSRVKFSGNEQLAQNDSSIVLWKLPQVDASTLSNGDEVDPEDGKLTPQKHILLRSKRYIYSATFDQRWIVYGTNENCCFLDRANCNEMRYASKKLPNCNLLELCDRSRYLVTVAGKVLNIIDLEKTVEEQDKKGRPVSHFKIVAEHMLKTAALQLLYVEHLNLLAVLCGFPCFAISFYKLEDGADKNLLRSNVIVFDKYRIFFMAYNQFARNEKTIYAYTCENRILKLDCYSSSTCLENQAGDIIGLPVDAHISGMLVLPDDQCILYDTRRFFRLDMKSNQVLSTNSDYSFIIRMDFISEKPDQVALAEILPEDYESCFPKLSINDSRAKRYGTR